MKVVLAAMVGAVLAGSAAAQSFTCGFGDRAACLGYGDTVCSSQGKCVSDSAVCFEAYQCNYQGFVCKSDLTECGEAHDSVVRRHNALLEDHRDLAEAAEALNLRHEAMKTCIEFARDLDAARACAW